MQEKRYVGTFISEDEVLAKIALLKEEGYAESDIYVVANDRDSLSIVRGQTDVDLLSSEGNWLDRFMAFINGDEEVRNAFSDMGFSEIDSARYYEEVKNGAFLLYVEPPSDSISTSVGNDFQTGYTDPNIGANLVVEESAESHSSLNTEPSVGKPFRDDEIGQRVVKDTNTIHGTIPLDESNRP